MRQVEILPPFKYRQPRLDHVEDVEQYVPGGYHPVDIGDILGTSHQRYEVIHKLGFGGNSTVWLVRSCGETPLYFAMKVLCASATTVSEVDVLQHLQRTAGPHPNVVALQDSFKVSGPNGEHHCLVFPVLGPSLHNSRVAKALSGPARYQVCCQVASAMAFIHAHGICHGDFTSSNVVFELPDIQSMSPDRLHQLLGPVKTEHLKLPKGVFSPHGPKKVVETASFAGLDCSALANIQIIDFGEAFFADHPPPSLGVPISYFPPELCFGYAPSAAGDVWQLACVIYTAQAKTPLFPAFFEVFEILVGTVAGLIGPLPDSWKGRYLFDKYGYREPGKAMNRTEPAYWFGEKESEKTIGSRMAKEAPHLSAPQRQEYVRLLHDMVQYEPGQRLTAANVLQRLQSPEFSTLSS